MPSGGGNKEEVCETNRRLAVQSRNPSVVQFRQRRYVEMVTPEDDLGQEVAAHYDRLDRFYRELWGEHVHHGLWTDPTFSANEAVRQLVHRVARAAQIEAGDRVCDVGCGYGAPARLWAEQYGAEVTGFTVSTAQYEYAASHLVDGPTPEYRLQDFLANHLPGASMDAVVAIESLTHIRDQPGVLREAARVLRPGGRLVVCAWMAGPSPAAWARRHLLQPICTEGRLSGLPTATELHKWTRDAELNLRELDDLTPMVRRTWTIIIARFARATLTDPSVLQTLFDRSMPDRVFARAVLRVWLAQRIGALRYGWLVAKKP